MPEPASSRLALVGPSANDPVSSGDDIIRAIITRLEAVGAGYLIGTAGARPAAAAANAGFFYLATDTGVLSESTGSAWVDINPKDAAAATASLRTLGTGATQAAAGNDARLSDARTPIAHKSTHGPGGSDALVSPTQLFNVADVGVLGQVRAGRVLTVADFTTILGLAQPVGLFNLGDLTNLGSGGALVNKGAVPFGPGVTGNGSEAAVFAGSTGQALYIADTGGSDPFRIPMGSWGCWFRTAKRGTVQRLVTKWGATSLFAFDIEITVNNTVGGYISTTGADVYGAIGSTDVCDDRWHMATATYDGSTICLYIDGVLEATALVTATIHSNAAPLNIGAGGADGSTAATSPHYGRIDEAFVTKDVLADDQVRFLYAVKVAHNLSLSTSPSFARVTVQRRKRGALLAVSDFTAQPRRLHNLNDFLPGDLGADNQALTLNNGPSNGLPGPDGLASAGAYGFRSAGSQYLSSTDTGLPTGIVSMGAWFRSTGTGASRVIMSYGGATGRSLYLTTEGWITVWDGSGGLAGPLANDGRWHHVVVVLDTAAADGLKRKLYLDGRLVVSDTTTPPAAVLAGANGFRVGRDFGGSGNYFNGGTARAFVCDYAMGAGEIAGLYAKGSQIMPASPKDSGEHVEMLYGAHLYVIADAIDPQHQLDLGIAA